MKSSIWTFHTDILQLAMTLQLSIGITKDKTMAVELSSNQFQICKAANGQFCNIPTPFQPLANLPTCTSALYARNLASISS